MGMCDLLLCFSRFNHLFKNLRKFGHFFSHHPPKVDRHVTAPAEKQSTPTQTKTTWQFSAGDLFGMVK